MSERTSLLIGDEGIEKLRRSSVVLCGCGAVGGYALEGLVRSGVGHIRVVDHDVFSESNLNRQILATTFTVGRPKVEVMKERMTDIDPDVRVTTHQCFFLPENADDFDFSQYDYVIDAVVDISGMDVLVNESTVSEIIDGEFDVLVDAIDTLRNKTALLRCASEKGIRTFSSMGAALHMDTQAVRVAPLMNTKTCPLAASLRKALRDCDTSMITAVYSEEPPVVKPSERDDHGKSVLGSLPAVPAVFGFTLANEAIRFLLKKSL